MKKVRQILNIDSLHKNNIMGDNVTVAVLDTGICNHPDFGEPSTIGPGEIPVFWACGVTPQAVAMAVKPEFMITHAPGHMFVTDLLNSELSIL